MNLPKFTKKAEARAWYEKANPTHSAVWVADMNRLKEHIEAWKRGE